MDIFAKLNFTSEVNSSIINLISQIEKFQGKWEVLDLSDNDFLNELRAIATIQSIGSSTRIEGSKLNDVEVQSLIDNLEISELEYRDEQEVIGYWETLELILDNSDEIELSERYIFQLHSLLLQYSSKDDRQRGKYKNLTNRVVATYPDGSTKTIFKTTEPHKVSQEMKEVLDCTNINLTEKKTHPLITIGTFVYEFLSIHPFHDGNGRLSRLLTTLLLVKEKYFFVQYVSFEHIIEKRKKEYYKALMDCQKDRYTDNENVGSWLVFFLGCIISLTKKLEHKLERIKLNDTYVNDRQKKILDLIKYRGKSRTADITKALKDISPNTIKKDLKMLFEKKLLNKEGLGKATTYYI